MVLIKNKIASIKRRGISESTSPKRHFQMPRFRPSKLECQRTNLEEMVFDIESMELPLHKYQALRRRGKMPQLAARLRVYRRLLDQRWLSTKVIDSGATIGNMERLFERIVAVCNERRLFHFALGSPLPRNQLRWKLAIDGRDIRNKKNEAIVLQPLNVMAPQAPSNIITLALGDVDERDRDRLARFVRQSGVDALVYKLRHTATVKANTTFSHEVNICTDWMSAVYMLRISAPNTSSADGCVCISCEVTKGYLNNGWRNDPFAVQLECANPEADSCLPCFTHETWRYCTMHACTRMLCEILACATEAAAPRSQPELGNIIRAVQPDWFKARSSGRLRDTLSCTNAKTIIQDTTLLQRFSLNCESGNIQKIRLPDAEQPLQLSRAQTVYLVLLAAQRFFQFAYTPWPDAAAFKTLLRARTVVLAFLAAHQARLWPATHWLTTHGIAFARKDGTWYWWLNEAVEASHKVDRRLARISNPRQHRHVQILRRLHLRREIKLSLARSSAFDVGKQGSIEDFPLELLPAEISLGGASIWA